MATKPIIDRALDLLRVADRFDVEDVEVELRGVSFHLSKGTAPLEGQSVAPRQAVDTSIPSSEPPPPPPPEEDSTFTQITSPMVGTFYRAPAPDKPPFVDVGQMVEVDQPVCIIEAMKLMNIIKASVRGKVVKILVENQTPVQAGQILFLVEPS